MKYLLYMLLPNIFHKQICLKLGMYTNYFQVHTGNVCALCATYEVNAMNHVTMSTVHR